MRFEFLITIIWFLFSFIYLILNKNIDFKWGVTILLITCYGPSYALLSFGPPPSITFSMAACFLIIFLWSRKINYKIFLFLSAILLISTISFLIFKSGMLAYFKGILSILIGYSGAIVGYKISIYNKKIFYSISIIYCFLAITVLVVRHYFAPFNDLRDAGLPLITISFAVLLLVKGKYFKSLSIFSYLFLILSRSVQITLFYSLISNLKSFQKKYGLVFISFFSIVSTIIIFNIIYNRTFSDAATDYSTGIDATFLTRLNAINNEIDAFKQSPIIGKGLFFYDTEWKDLTSLIQEGSSNISDLDYVAYNHIGYTSILAQIGIIGFYLIIILPFFIWKKFKPRNFEERIISQTFIMYLIIFLMSGSPIRTDFPDQFYYYLLIGYMFASNSKILTND